MLTLHSKTPKGDYVAENEKGRIFTIPARLVTDTEVLAFEQTHKSRKRVRKPVEHKTGRKTNVGDPTPHGFSNK